MKNNLRFEIKEDMEISPSDFVKLVMAKFLKREGVFSEYRNIEDYIPLDATPVAQALWLFYVVQVDYAVRGRVLYPGAVSLYNNNADFYSPDFIGALKDADLYEILTQNLKPRYPNEAVIRYKVNSKRLKEHFGSNPLNIFTSVKSAKDVIDRIYSFRGMGPKTGNLFFRSMVLFFNLDYEDIDSVLPPVDIHDVRIAYLLGFVETDEMSERNIKKVKVLWNTASNDSRVKWMLFDRALWLLGSEGKPKSKKEILTLLVTS